MRLIRRIARIRTLLCFGETGGKKRGERTTPVNIIAPCGRNGNCGGEFSRCNAGRPIDYTRRLQNNLSRQSGVSARPTVIHRGRCAARVAALRARSRTRARRIGRGGRVKANRVHNERRSSIIESAGPRNCTHLTGCRLFVQFQPPGIDSEQADELLALPIKVPDAAEIANSFQRCRLEMLAAREEDANSGEPKLRGIVPFLFPPFSGTRRSEAARRDSRLFVNLKLRTDESFCGVAEERFGMICRTAQTCYKIGGICDTRILYS